MWITKRKLPLNTPGILLVILSLSHWFPFGINVLELLGAFAHFTLGISLLTLVASLYFRQWFLVSCGVLGSLICGALVGPHFTSVVQPGEESFTIGQFNVYHYNSSPQRAVLDITEAEADILAIQELNSNWSSILDSNLKKKYPFFIEKPWDQCCYGIGLYSKYPITESRVFELQRTPAVQATVNINGKLVSIITFHTRPPIFPNETKDRNLQLEQVAKMTNTIKGPQVIFGDWNIVPWDATFQQFRKNTKLGVARDGLQTTYPMNFGIALIPIDYIAYSRELSPIMSQPITIAGSDHRGVVASFKLE